MSFFSLAADAALNIFFPVRCPVCDRVRPFRLPRRTEPCPACRGKLEPIPEPFCRRCGKALPTEVTEYCFDCSRRHFSFARNISLFPYTEAARDSVVRFKYYGRREYASYYVRELLAARGKMLAELHADAIIPVPIHKSRLRRRGYNQAELIAEGLSKALDIPLRTDLLYRVRRTTAQKKLGPQARIRNLQNALLVREDCSGFRHLLLVDDIYTTGSTLEACSRALLTAGAGRISCVTVFVGSAQ